MKNKYKMRSECHKAISNSIAFHSIAFPDGLSGSTKDGSTKDGYQRGKDQSLLHEIKKNNGENHDNKI